jgi:hypothetical protein
VKLLTDIPWTDAEDAARTLVSIATAQTALEDFAQRIKEAAAKAGHLDELSVAIDTEKTLVALDAESEAALSVH